MPRRRRTERDRIYLDRLRNLGPLSNVQLANAVRDHPEFLGTSRAALTKDISRFVKRETRKTINKVNGKLVIREGGQATRFSFELMQIQVDVRDVEATKKLHVCWNEEIRNISNKPIRIMSVEISSTKPQSLEEISPGISIRLGSLEKKYDLKELRIDKKSTPYNLRFEFDLPKKLREAQTIIRTLTHDSLDLDPDFTITDIAPSRRIVFDLIKKATDTEDLDCVVSPRHELNGRYVAEIAKPQTVIDIRTGNEAYALRLVLDDPQDGYDYRFEYKI